MSKEKVSTTFTYNGVSYEFDVRDADQSEALENAISEMDKEEKLLPKDGKISGIIREQCNMIKRFFDRVLSEGAGTAICSEKSNISVCYEAYDHFLMLVREQRNDTIESKSVFSKYSNRQQRRAAEKNKK